MKHWLFDAAASDAPALREIVRRYVWSVPIIGLASLAGTALEGLGIGLVVPLLAMLSTSQHKPAGALQWLWSAPEMVPQSYRFAVILCFILGCVMVKGLLTTATGRLVATVEMKAGHDLRMAIGRRLASVEYDRFASLGSARLMYLFGTESWKVSDSVRSFFNIIAAASNVLVFSVLLAFLNPILFAFSAVGFAVIRMLEGGIKKVIRRNTDEMQRSNVTLERAMIQLSGPLNRVMRIFGREGSELIRLEGASLSVGKQIGKIHSLRSQYLPAVETAYSVIFLTTLGLSEWLQIPAPVLIAFLAIMYRLLPHVHSLSSNSVELAAVGTSLDDIRQFLDGPTVASAGSSQVAHPLKNEIRFARVSYSYPSRPEQLTLCEVEFVVRAGRWTGVSGASGAGKSTVVNLLCRFADDYDGSVLVDGEELRQIDVGSWRALIGRAV